ncbi:PEP-CTERM sorting domain-containing protein [Luteolibacter flavescens]|uniref:PEP-CTERM sorting domain-containing protein n=1 Tax=Luteolibacter flavescens TaxID=1859460 RepID=A0ABT3FPR2_9BACT|nr:PEP-CTERM sorting domain-containing protein [Luteolibacter flavescens]MCW1885557.1 PEP-CTERM sorting domain-containing protein [Luteolibacter flavescens]
MITSRNFRLACCLTIAAAAIPTAHAAVNYVSLGGPATGGLALANYKNSTTQDGIENKTGGNGLAQYPNFQIPTGYTNAGRWTAIVTSPQSTSTNYATKFSNAFYGGSPITVHNQTVTDADHSTMSAGLIGYDTSALTGFGTETIPLSGLTINFDTYQWDGYTASGWNTGVGNVNISPFSTVHTIYNEGGGAGNAAGFYNISLTNATGTGLTFVDGQLTSMDISGTLNVLMQIGNFPGFGSATFTGTFSTSGLNYAFDVKDTETVAVFTGINMIMDRAGTAFVIPEPSSLLLGALGLLAAVRRRR